jgi:hypothetical protein
MTKKSGDGKIGGVKSSAVKPTDNTKEIAGTGAISEVGEVTGVRATSAVAGSTGVGSVGSKRGTRAISFEEREQIFKVVQEEAEKIFGQTGMSESRKKTVTEAVKMAIDAGLIQSTPTDKKK